MPSNTVSGGYIARKSFDGVNPADKSSKGVIGVANQQSFDGVVDRNHNELIITAVDRVFSQNLVRGVDTNQNEITSAVDLAETPQDFTKYKIYPHRWFVLTVVALLNFSIALIWICYAAVANYTDEFYCRESGCDAADWLSLIFMIVSIPMGFIAMWSVDKYGLRPGILVGCWVTLIGCLIRIISSAQIVPANARFPVVITGQVLAATVQPFIKYLPTKVAAFWFPKHQRATATTVASMSNPLGILTAMVVSPQLVDSPNRIFLLNCLTMIPGGLATGLATFGVCSSLPPTPPTASAAQISLPFWNGLKTALKTKAFLILILSLGGGMGLFKALYILLQQLLCPHGYSNDFVGLCGALLIISGSVGSVIAGIIVDKTKQFVLVAKLCYALGGVFSWIFCVVSLRPGMAVGVAISCALSGLFGLAFYPIGLELGVECTFPVAEATTAGLITISGQIQGVIYVLTMEEFSAEASTRDKEQETCTKGNLKSVPVKNWTVSSLVWCGMASFMAIVFILFFWPKLKRREIEALDRKNNNRSVTNVTRL